MWTREDSGDGEGGSGGVRLRRSIALGLVVVRRYKAHCFRGLVTNVVKAVFPLPLGPTSNKVGCCAAAAAFLYRMVCIIIGRPIATMKVMSMVRGFGEKAAVSQLSWSYHAIEAEMR